MTQKTLSENQSQNLTHRHYVTWAVGDGSTTDFALPRTVIRADDLKVFVSGLLKRPFAKGVAYDYRIRGLSDPATYPGDSNKVKFTSAPANGANIGFDTAGG